MKSRFARTSLLATALWLGLAGATQGGSAYMRGDANDDGSITLADAIYVARYLFEMGPMPQPDVNTGDANCSGRVDLLDIVYLVNHLMRGGPEPRCPTH